MDLVPISNLELVDYATGCFLCGTMLEEHLDMHQLIWFESRDIRFRLGSSLLGIA